MMKFKYIITILLIIAGINLNAQILVPKSEAQLETRLSRISFCISLIPSSNSGAVSYGIHRLRPDGKAEVTHLSFDAFLRQFCGYEESRANPDRINYMEEYGISQATIKNLWKLRYASYPFGKSNEPGYGRECGVPTDGQMQILKQYGIEFVSDAVYGENLFNLLKDFENPAWISKYSATK